MRSVGTWPRWIAVITWAALIWILSSIPNLSSGLEQDLLLRKIAHVAVFGVLTGLVYAALRATRSLTQAPRQVIITLAAISVLGYALIDELHQSFVFGRHGAAQDVAIDVIGIAIVLAATLLYQIANHQRQTNND